MDSLFARWIEHNSERPAKWQIFKMRKWKKEWRNMKNNPYFEQENVGKLIIWPRMGGKTTFMNEMMK